LVAQRRGRLSSAVGEPWQAQNEAEQQPRQELQEDSAMTIGTIDGKKAMTQGTSSPFVLTILTTPGSAALRIENSELPADIQVDEKTNQEVVRRLAAGVQIYDCDPASGTFSFREPHADLYDLDTVAQRGIHFATEPGPNWTDADGSRTSCLWPGGAKLVVSVDAPAPADPTRDVRWLKVEAAQNFGSNGVFSGVTFIQRVLTFGGQAPPSCTAGTTVSVPYTALYIFWGPR
jgi:Protein of unknown function (DUF3455)